MKLLRALQQRSVQRLGGRDDTQFDVRVVAATNIDLVAAVARGTFRQDLYYRLSVYQLRVPPLRARGAEDVRMLARAIVAHLAARRHRPVPALDPHVVDLFGRYTWPGNVRELENTIERMLVHAGDASLLTQADLPEGFGSLRDEPTVTGAAADGFLFRSERPLPSSITARLVLEKHGFKRAPAARELGLSRHQLYRLLRSRAP